MHFGNTFTLLSSVGTIAYFDLRSAVCVCTRLVAYRRVLWGDQNFYDNVALRAFLLISQSKEMKKEKMEKLARKTDGQMPSDKTVGGEDDAFNTFLLDLIVYCLYCNKEVFLRELIRKNHLLGVQQSLQSAGDVKNFL
ncbi:hypothetical protein MKW94_014409 [Papaver nudicaule]|uniref:Uncharacterized protein n=1 Tax=Papaver nudicaule TaxID=74823 RepID=A0AA41VHU1_PAPNU|nr:hypothetical protein [Papaver nudicaule]